MAFGDFMFMGEMKITTFAELVTMKAKIKNKMSLKVDSVTKSSLATDLYASPIMQSKLNSISHSGMN